MNSEGEREQVGEIRWTDPRQKEIYESLLMIGEGPAAFYRDACRVMARIIFGGVVFG